MKYQLAVLGGWLGNPFWFAVFLDNGIPTGEVGETQKVRLVLTRELGHLNLKKDCVPWGRTLAKGYRGVLHNDLLQ